MSVVRTAASATPPCERAKRIAISPGLSCDPDTIAASVSRTRCPASRDTCGARALSRAFAMYAANRPVMSASGISIPLWKVFDHAWRPMRCQSARCAAHVSSNVRPRKCESHHAPPARVQRSRALPRDRPDAGASRPHRRPPARGLGRRRDPGADARAHARRRHPGRPGRLGLPVHPPQQALDHAEPQGGRGHRGPEEARREGRRAPRELPPRREDAAGHRLRGALEGEPAARLREHLGLRPDRPLRHPPRLRPDRAGHGRAHVGDGTAGPGTGARGHPHRRPVRRHLRGLRRDGGPPRAREPPARANGCTPRSWRRCST